MEEYRFFIYLLKQVKGIGNIGILKIIRRTLDTNWQQWSISEITRFGEIKQQHLASFTESFQQVINNQEYWYHRYGHDTFITILDECYPEYLLEIYNPPVLVYYAGNIHLLKKVSIAMIGSRNHSEYGERMVAKLVPPLVKNKFVTVSGLAKGIDVAVHQHTIRNGGETIAVIGSGLDVFYPKHHEKLQRYLMTYHLVLSEYPRGTAPLPYHFPMRNRIIAGISRGTCVIEAKVKSGTLITAQLALEAGREVFAVPGNSCTKQSDGCHSLIQQGAKCVWEASHLLEEIHEDKTN